MNITKYTPNKFLQTSAGGCCMYCMSIFFDDEEYIKRHKLSQGTLDNMSRFQENVQFNALSEFKIQTVIQINHFSEHIYIHPKLLNNALFYYQYYKLLKQGNFMCFPMTIHKNSNKRHRVYLIIYKGLNNRSNNFIIDPVQSEFQHRNNLEFSKDLVVYNLDVYSNKSGQPLIFNTDDFTHLFKNQ